MPDVKAKLDVNKFVEQARVGIGALLHGAGVESSVIYNNTKALVTFYVYNYIDIVYLICPEDAGRAGVLRYRGGVGQVRQDSSER
jgi:hypothetical protein